MNDTDQLPRQLRLLKALVIGLGVLLGIAALVVVFAVLWKLSNKPQGPANSEGPANSQNVAPAIAAGGEVQPVADLAAFGIAELPLPVSCQVESATAAGDRLVLLIEGPDDCRRVLIADLRTGKLLGQFQFSSQ